MKSFITASHYSLLSPLRLTAMTNPYHCPEDQQVARIAADFTALWRAGQFVQAGEKYWDEHVVAIQPSQLCLSCEPVCQGIRAIRENTLKWLETHGIEDLTLDGPFITGNQFALFADMFIAHAGHRSAHSEIVIFIIRQGRIVEERHFFADPR